MLLLVLLPCLLVCVLLVEPDGLWYSHKGNELVVGIKIGVNLHKLCLYSERLHLFQPQVQMSIENLWCAVGNQEKPVKKMALLVFKYL